MMERKPNILLEKSEAFAGRIVKMYQYLITQKKEQIMSKQVVRSGTSIGANIAESRNAQSVMDYINKQNIALKEADETEYWLELLYATEIINEEEFSSLSKDAKQIIGTLVKILKTTKAAAQ